MKEARRAFPTLALRIYLVGLAQFAVVAAGLFALFEASRPKFGPRDDEARFTAVELERDFADPIARTDMLTRIDRDLHASAVVIDVGGNELAKTEGTAVPHCPAIGQPPPEVGDRRVMCVTTPFHLPDRSMGELRFGVVGPPPPPPVGLRVIGIVLLVVGVSSWLLSRSLTRPLRKLSATARALGEGDLTARVGFSRTDELGNVARAFDDMADRLSELLKAEKELLANVSHELRTPLARIRVAVDLANEGDAEVAREALTDIGSDLAELERLITDTLTAARLDLAGASSGGIPPLRLGRVEPATIVARAAERFRGAHPQRTIEVEVGRELPVIDADEVLLRRAVDNLLENAHKYTEDPGRPVVLKANGSTGDLEIEIRDKGVGISKDDLGKVFRPFFRADRSRTRKTGGLGLGLALTKRIVEGHGGTLVIESELHRGTTARIRIPGAPKAPKRAPSLQSQTS